MDGRRRYEQLMLDQDDGEGDMAALKKLVLESMRSTLVENVDPTKFLPFLRSKFVVSDRENAQIKAGCARSVYDGADTLVDVLCTKGARGYDLLCEAIHSDQTQLYLLKQMNMRLEKLRYTQQQQQATSMATARPVEQRNFQPPYMPPSETTYLPSQHPGGQVILSPSTTTGGSTYAPQLPPEQYVRQSQQHYNRGGVANTGGMAPHGYDYYTANFTGRGGVNQGPNIGPCYQAPTTSVYPMANTVFSTGNSTHSVDALPLPPPTNDDPDNIPRGQEQ